MTVYTIENFVYHARAGLVRAYKSRSDRDAALTAMRAEAVRNGLAESSAMSGILPASAKVRDAGLLEQIGDDPGMWIDAR
jgi:hypothetical protein